MFYASVLSYKYGFPLNSHGHADTQTQLSSWSINWVVAPSPLQNEGRYNYFFPSNLKSDLFAKDTKQN